MGRRIVSGVSGTSGLGTLTVTSSTISTVQSNSDLTLDPNGTGGVVIVGDVTVSNQGDIRLQEASGNGTNYLAMQAAASMASNYTITWPSAVAGGAGYYLASDTSGTLSWSAFPSSGLTSSDAGSTSTVHYLLFETNSGSIPTGTISTTKVRSNISFVPSTGILTTSGYVGATHDGSTSNSGTLTLRGTSSATKATASILMSDGVASTTTGTGTLVVTGGVGVSGQVTCSALSATTITETSSITLKENINPIENALTAVLALQAYTYDRKDGSVKNEAGLIAEEVFKIIPNLVQLNKDGKPEGIKYTKMTAYLIESIKALKEEINLLKDNKI